MIGVGSVLGVIGSKVASKALPYIASMAGSAINAHVALKNQQEVNEARKRESELAWKRQQEAIREQNAYNSASAQMARLQSAGLNPNLMYANGQEASAGMQDSIPEYTPANYETGVAPLPPIGTDTIQSMIGLKDLKNKTDLTVADIALKSTQGLDEVSKAGLNDAQRKLILQQWGFNELYNPLELMHKQVSIALDKNRSAQVLSEIRKNAYLMREISARTGLSLAETERICGLWLYERDNILSEIHNRKYQNLNLASQAQLAFANSEYLRGMLMVNVKRYYLDESLGFGNLKVNQDKVKVMRDYVELSKEQWKLNKRKLNWDFWIGNGDNGFSRDMMNMGTGLINLLGSPMFSSALPSNPIGFRP